MIDFGYEYSGVDVIQSQFVPRFFRERRKIPLRGRGISVYRWFETKDRAIFRVGKTLYVHPETYREIERAFAKKISADFDNYIAKAFLMGAPG